MAAITTAESLARALGCTGPGPQFACRCPAHEDSSPSLSVTDGKDGLILLKCFAGCSYAAIKSALTELGLSVNNKLAFGKLRIAETYDYRDAAGELIYQVVRLEPKSFRCRRPTTHGGWEWHLNGIERIPYRLPELLLAISATKWVFVVEGEKDANALFQLKLTATCNSGGAGHWPEAFAACFKGANVIVVPDNDDIGKRHAFEVAQNLSSVANQVRLIELPGVPPKGDVSDFILAGATRDDLIELAQNAPNWDQKFESDYAQTLTRGDRGQSFASSTPLMEDAAENSTVNQRGSLPAREVPADANESVHLARPADLSVEEILVRFIHVGRGPVTVDSFNIIRKWRPVEFEAAFAHSREMLEKKVVPRTRLWACDFRRTYVETMTFDPSRDRVFKDQDMTHLNLWTPPIWESANPSLAAPFFEHLNYVVPDATSRNDLLDWLAHAVQQPGIRPHHHFLLVATTEGIGRGFIGEVIRKLWGLHSGEADLHKLMDDNFNSELSAKIFMVVNEVKAPTSERYPHRHRLKSLLTDTNIRINEKNLPRWTERFVARFLMFTNREDALPLSESDRRVYVVRCADNPHAANYYIEAYNRLKDPQFLAAVWATLVARDISKFNPGRRAPLNEIKTQMIAAGRTDDQQRAVEFCELCPFSVVAAVDLMRIVVPLNPQETLRDRKVRTNSVTAILRETSRQTHGRKIRIENDTTRVWILSDASKWTTCMPAVISAELMRAREAFKAGSWDADILMEAWQESL